MYELAHPDTTARHTVSETHKYTNTLAIMHCVVVTNIWSDNTCCSSESVMMFMFFEYCGGIGGYVPFKMCFINI